MTALAWAADLEVLHCEDGTAVLVGDRAVLLSTTAGRVLELVSPDGTTWDDLAGAVALRFGEEALTPSPDVPPLDAMVDQLVEAGILVRRTDPDQ